MSRRARQATSGEGYLATHSDRVTIILRTKPAVDDLTEVSAVGFGGWRSAQSDGQSIHTKRAADLLRTRSRRVGSPNCRRALASICVVRKRQGLIAVGASGTYVSRDTGSTWALSGSASLAGWMDASDKLVAGDFTGSGWAQLLFLNTDGGSQGAASLRQDDAASNSFAIVETVPWTKVVGVDAAIWKLASAKTVSGGFLGLNKDQLMFINPSGAGVAISIWAYESASGKFTEVHKMNYGPDEIPTLNSLLDANDWQLGF